jgi:hypothetical protein
MTACDIDVEHDDTAVVSVVISIATGAVVVEVAAVDVAEDAAQVRDARLDLDVEEDDDDDPFFPSAPPDRFNLDLLTNSFSVRF